MVQSIILLTMMAIVGTQAQIPFIGGCPKVSIKNNFVPTSYLGLWYEQEKYFAIFQFGGKCTTAKYSPINGTTISVFNSNINTITGQPSTISGTATLKGASNIADLLVVFPSSPFPGPYQVLETDYNNYAVVHSCNDFGFFSFKFVWILTRQRFPPLDVMQTAYGVLDSNRLPRSLLLKTDQVNCNYGDDQHPTTGY